MVRPGNPHRIQGLADLNKAGVRFVNRALGTGTRVLLDELLAAEDLAAADVRGYHDVEPSHAAVAQAVAAGGADAGLGIEAAARARGLDFVPLINEDYHLVCLKEALDEAPVAALRALLASPGWAHELNALPGYQASHAGEVRSMASVLPWWQFKQPKRRAGMPARR